MRLLDAVDASANPTFPRLQQVLAGHRPQSTEAERLRDQGRDPRKFQGNTRAVLQLLTLISRHRLLSRWGPFLDAVNITIEALTTKTLPSPAAAIEDGRRDQPISAPRTGRRVCRTRFTERRMRRQYSRRRAVRDSEAQSTWANAQYFRTGFAVQQGSRADPSPSRCIRPQRLLPLMPRRLFDLHYFQIQ
jgi:hypothetical protein